MQRQSPDLFNWASLPDELKLTILSFLTPRSLPFTLNSSFFRLTNENTLWQGYYKRDFGKLPCADNAKLQYLMAALYQKAETSPRPDIAQMYFVTLIHFLNYSGLTRENHPWFVYYQGVMQSYGKGCAVNLPEGIARLCKSFEQGDYRAGPELAKILIENVDHAQVLMPLLSSQVFYGLISQLRTDYPKQPYFISRLIGHLYLHGITTNQDREKAAEYFSSGLKTNLEDSLCDFMCLKPKTISEDSFLKRLIEQYGLHADALALKKQNLLEETPDDIEQLKQAFIDGDLNSGIKLFNYLDNSDSSEIVPWLQLAAQFNDYNSLEQLEDLCENQDAFALFAMGIISYFGILNSFDSRDPDQAQRYFHEATNVDRNIFDAYFESLEMKNIYPQTVLNKMKEQVESLQPVPKSFFAKPNC